MTESCFAFIAADNTIKQLRSFMLLVASHTPDLLRKFCNKGLLIKQGRVVMFDALNKVLAMYEGGNY